MARAPDSLIARTWRGIGAARLFLIDARHRSAWWTRLSAGDALHQDSTLTWPDRYPRLFGEAQRLLGAGGAHRLLSFGCSSGEEVLSLARYFPYAELVGAEINRAQLRACRALPADPRISFIHSSPARIAAAGPYDAIFCMAVFQRRPHEIERRGRTDIGRLYPFARFDAEIAALVAQLRPGGLLIVDHSLFLVEHSTAAAWLEPVAGVGTAPAKGPRFDPAGALIAPAPVIDRVFRKTGPGADGDTR